MRAIELLKLTPFQRYEGIGWLEDCGIPVSPDVTNLGLIRKIDRHYDGGIDWFLLASGK